MLTRFFLGERRPQEPQPQKPQRDLRTRIVENISDIDTRYEQYEVMPDGSECHLGFVRGSSISALAKKHGAPAV